MSELELMIKSLKDTLDKLEVTRQESKLTGVSSPPVINGDDYYKSIAEEYIEFTYKCPTIYHVVQYFSEKLTANGFKYISEKASWKDVTPGKYFTIRNGSSIIVFNVGKDWTPAKGIAIIGSHIDSLTVLLKPNSIKSKVDGYDLLGVANYAGSLGDPWWDRDLGIGGRLLFKDSNGCVTQKLVDSTPQPIARIPTLAPHFGTPSQGPFNKETQAVPVVGFSSKEEDPATDDEKSCPLFGMHSLKLLRFISKISGVPVKDINQIDLQLFDVQKGTFGGLDEEFLFAPRIDDRICSFAAISALIEASNANLLSSDSFSMVGLFDHEEVGSGSRTGIRGGLLESTVKRLLSTSAFADDSSIEANESLAYANSIILSADVNHLVNPNFTQYYLEHHKPVPNKGITIAVDPNGHFATDSTGIALMEDLAKLNDDKLQYFQIRNDSRSGGSIGPLISLQTGARTIDLGIAQLSMHSIRATTGSKDVGLGTKFFRGFFANWRNTYDKYSDL